MATFFGEMKQVDQSETMPATVKVDKGTISLVSGRTVLGEWKLYQVVIEEVDDRTIAFEADNERVLLMLQEHASFLADTASNRRDGSRARRSSIHPAFRTEPEGPSLGEELKEGVSREVTSVADEIRGMREYLEPGPPLWIGLGVFAVLVLFLPTLLVGLCLLVGVAALLVGALGYADSGIATRIPGSLTPVRLVAMGVVLVILGIVVGLIR